MLQALLEHAIDPGSVASVIWNALEPYSHNIVNLQDNPQRLDAFNVKILGMSKDELTEKIIAHAKEWVTLFLLPSMLFSPAPL